MRGARVDTNGLREDVAHGPALAEPRLKGSDRDADVISPLRHRHGASAMGQSVVDPAIVLLGRSDRPPAVPGRVAALVVNSIEAVRVRRPGAHVDVEAFKGLAPLVGDPDASTAVVRVASVPRVGTARLHLSPCLVLGSLRQSMARGEHTGPGASVATAGQGAATSEITSVDSFDCLAIAPTNPAQLPARSARLGQFKDRQASESPASQVYEFWRHAPHFTSVAA